MASNKSMAKAKRIKEASDSEEYPDNDFSAEETLSETGNPDISDDDDESDENEDYTDDRKRSKKIYNDRASRSRFVDTEAAMGDFDDFDEDEEEDEEEDDFVDNEIEEKEKKFSAAFERRLEAHAARRNASRTEYEGMDPEEIEARLRERYASKSKRSDFDYPADSGVPSRIIQPRINDPKLWLVKCRQGGERTAAALLLKQLPVENPPIITAAISRDALRGFLYIEAHRAADVVRAIRSAKASHMIFASQKTRPQLIPSEEINDVLSPSLLAKQGALSLLLQNRKALVPGSWVRVKRGKYAGDLASVVAIENAENEEEAAANAIRIRIVPRIAYTPISTASKKKQRPTARLFDPEEASRHGVLTKSRGHWIFGGETYKDGYLIKEIRGGSLTLKDVNPTREEIERFGANSFPSAASNSNTDQDLVHVKNSFIKGESILVTAGEFSNTKGTVESEKDGLVTVNFDGDLGKQPIPARLLVRNLQVGDMVCTTTDGESRTGMLVAIDGDSAVVFSPLNGTQFTVSMSSLRSISTNQNEDLVNIVKSRGLDAQLQVNGLISIDGDTPAIVIRVSSDDRCVFVVDANGNKQTVPFNRISIIPPNSSSSTRRDALRVGDRVEYDTQSSSSPTAAVIIQIFNQLVFLRVIETGDVAVRQLSQIARPSALVASTADGVFEKPLRPKPNGPFGGQSYKHMIGKSITIMGAGPYKGYVGIIKELTETLARVELHTDCRVVSVSKERVLSSNYEGSFASAHNKWDGGKTPAWGSSDGKTPAWGAAGGKTPAWGAAGGKTPAWGAAGGKTPAWGASSGKTPAWGASSGKTPAWGASSEKTPGWGSSGGKTPAWGASGGKTPAWGENGSKAPAASDSTESKTPAWGGISYSKPALSSNEDIMFKNKKYTESHDDGYRNNSYTAGQQQSRASSDPQYLSNRVESPIEKQSERPAESVQKKPSWAEPGVHIAITQGHQSGVKGVIASVSEVSGQVFLSGQDKPLPLSSLVPIVPGKKDIVRVLGEDRATGTVIGLDGPDAVIRVDGTADFRILPIENLVKITRDLS